jgi:tetratricopeptide (TPR) repeat protein
MNRPFAAALTLALALVFAGWDAQGAPSPADVDARRARLRDASAADPTVDSARAMIRLAEGAEGELLPEVGRALVQLGEKAVPALIEARGGAAAPATRAWATDELELLGKRTPGDAVQTGDRALLCEVLRAYGATRDVDALPAVLAFVGAERSDVRTAARAAVLAYGDVALRRLREAYAARTGVRASPSTPPDAVAHALFDACDRERLRDVDALFDRGLAAEHEGRTADAVIAFDAAVAQQPDYPRRADAAPAYVAYARSVASSDPTRASAYLRKALRVAPEGAQADPARSELAVLEGRAMSDHGLTETTPFARALALDPTNVAARAELERFRVDASASRAEVHWVGRWSLGAGLVLMLAASLAMARRSRRQS